MTTAPLVARIYVAWSRFNEQGPDGLINIPSPFANCDRLAAYCCLGSLLEATRAGFEEMNAALKVRAEQTGPR